MQINSSTAHVTDYSQMSVKRTGGSSLPQIPSTKAPNDPFSQYDLHNISPKEIDNLASKLRENGKFDVRDILMLETHGEKFQSHLSSVTGRGFDASKKSDLIGSIEQNIEMSKQMNDPFDSAESLLKLLQQVDASKSIPRNGLFA
jgi:hypothetical protein